MANSNCIELKRSKETPHYVDLYKLLIKRLERNLEGVEKYTEAVQNDTKNVGVFDFNTVNTNGLEFVEKRPNIVVTSPPYGDSGTQQSLMPNFLADKCLARLR